MRVDALCSRVNEPFQNMTICVLDPGEHGYARVMPYCPLPGLWAPACPEPVSTSLMATWKACKEPIQHHLNHHFISNLPATNLTKSRIAIGEIQNLGQLLPCCKQMRLKPRFIHMLKSNNVEYMGKYMGQ